MPPLSNLLTHCRPNHFFEQCLEGSTIARKLDSTHLQSPTHLSIYNPCRGSRPELRYSRAFNSTWFMNRTWLPRYHYCLRTFTPPTITPFGWTGKEPPVSRRNYLFFKWGTTTGPPIFDGCQEGKERRDVGWMEALRPPFLLPQPNGWILVRPSVATFLFRNFRNYFQNFSSERSSELQLRS
jgi:hypothetical protein